MIPSFTIRVMNILPKSTDNPSSLFQFEYNSKTQKEPV